VETAQGGNPTTLKTGIGQRASNEKRTGEPKEVKRLFLIGIRRKKRYERNNRERKGEENRDMGLSSMQSELDLQEKLPFLEPIRGARKSTGAFWGKLCFEGSKDRA